MKFFNKILIILVVFSLYQCNNQDKAKQKSTTFQKQQNKKPIVKKAWDSLNRSNTEAFFNV